MATSSSVLRVVGVRLEGWEGAPQGSQRTWT